MQKRKKTRDIRKAERDCRSVKGISIRILLSSLGFAIEFLLFWLIIQGIASLMPDLMKMPYEWFVKLFGGVPASQVPTSFYIFISIVLLLLERGGGDYFQSVLRFVWVNKYLLFLQGENEIIRHRAVPVRKGFTHVKTGELIGIINAFLNFQGTGVLRVDLPNRNGLRFSEYLRTAEETLNPEGRFRLRCTWDNRNLIFRQEFSNARDYFLNTLPTTVERIFICEKSQFPTIQSSSEWGEFVKNHIDRNVPLYLLYAECLGHLENLIGGIRSYEFGVIVNKRGAPEYVLGIVIEHMGTAQQQQLFYLNIGREAEEYNRAINVMLEHIRNCSQGCHHIKTWSVSTEGMPA